MKYQGGGKKGYDDEDPPEKSKEEMNYLDADEDHLDGKDKLSEVIHMRNQQKIKFLQKENSLMKQQLDDATDNIIINKNMIKLFIDNQDNQDHSKIVDKLNEENRSVYK